MKVLVTGANGMLGQDLCPILKKANYEAIETDIHNLDITKLGNVKEFLEKEKERHNLHRRGRCRQG